MGILRDFTMEDVRDKTLPKDGLLDKAGVLYLMSDVIDMTFQDYYDNYFNQEYIYHCWKHERL
jgi:hypothetical protein